MHCTVSANWLHSVRFASIKWDNCATPKSISDLMPRMILQFASFQIFRCCLLRSAFRGVWRMIRFDDNTKYRTFNIVTAVLDTVISKSKGNLAEVVIQTQISPRYHPSRKTSVNPSVSDHQPCSL